MQTLKLRHEVTIHALTTKLWKVLTSSEYTEQFLFDGKLVSEWMEGNPILLVEETGGHQKITPIGEVESVVPGLQLRFRLSTLGEYYREAVTFHYELSPDDEGIRLALSQEAATTQNALSLLKEYGKMMLQKIKWLAEYA